MLQVKSFDESAKTSWAQLEKLTAGCLSVFIIPACLISHDARERTRDLPRMLWPKLRLPEVSRGMCIASVACCASARIFTTCIRFRAFWLSPLGKPVTAWSRLCPTKLERRCKELWLVRSSLRRRCMAFDIFAAGIRRRMRNPFGQRARCYVRWNRNPRRRWSYFCLAAEDRRSWRNPSTTRFHSTI